MISGVNRYSVADGASRPWGAWSVVAAGPGFAVKQITVNPGGRLSLQRHRTRDEHWVVVSGAADAIIDGEARCLAENESAFIKAGSIHRLSNPGPGELVIIEVQYGDLLDERDIERLQDIYGRVESE